MRKSLLALVSLMAAGVAMAAEDGVFIFKTYRSADCNLRFAASDGSPIQTPDWYCTLLDINGAQVMGSRVGGGGALEPVIAPFLGTTGFVITGGDWALKGFEAVRCHHFFLAAYYDPTGAGYQASTLRASSGPYPVCLGTSQMLPIETYPPDFGGAIVCVITVPEPSLLLLGLLGSCVFWARRAAA